MIGTRSAEPLRASGHQTTASKGRIHDRSRPSVDAAISHLPNGGRPYMTNWGRRNARDFTRFTSPFSSFRMGRANAPAPSLLPVAGRRIVAEHDADAGARGGADVGARRRLGGVDVTGLHRMEIGRHTSELQSLMRISYAVFCL